VPTSSSSAVAATGFALATGFFLPVDSLHTSQSFDFHQINNIKEITRKRLTDCADDDLPRTDLFGGCLLRLDDGLLLPC